MTTPTDRFTSTLLASVLTFAVIAALGMALDVPPPPLWTAIPLAVAVTGWWIWWDLRKAMR